MRRKDQQETCIAWAKPAAEQSTTRPCRSSRGAKAMEWMTKSSPPHSAAIRSNTASSAPGASTSRGIVMPAPRRSASGRTCGSALAFSQVTASSAPRPRSTSAQPKAMELSLAMPTTRPRRPRSMSPIRWSGSQMAGRWARWGALVMAASGGVVVRRSIASASRRGDSARATPWRQRPRCAVATAECQSSRSVMKTREKPSSTRRSVST